jgi:ribosomal protein S18 acetylase RimI-like enzyme
MATQVRIGLAVPSDAPAIAALSREAIEYGLTPTWAPRRILGSLRNPDTNVVVARDADGLLGFGIMDYGDTSAHLALFAVRRDGRRLGVGSALLGWLEKCARVAGIAVIRAEVRTGNREARAFYGRHGYAEGVILAGYYQGVEDALKLEKNLSR